MPAVTDPDLSPSAYLNLPAVAFSLDLSRALDRTIIEPPLPPPPLPVTGCSCVICANARTTTGGLPAHLRFRPRPPIRINERAPDARADRHAARNPEHRRTLRTKRRKASRKLSRLWKDWRLDRRFALPRLVAYLTKHDLAFPIDTLAAQLHCKRFAADATISTELYRTAAAHRSLSNPNAIACYPTRADAARSREVVMAPGKFFAAALPLATPAEVQALAEAFLAVSRPPAIYYAPNTDPDLWARVYRRRRGFQSCMGNNDTVDEWTDSDSPVRFYAHPDNDLALAYLTTGGPEGATTARAIVNRRNKHYVRVYGDARLKETLEAAGYKHSPTSALDGQLANAVTNGYDDLVAPYIDGEAHYVRWDGGSDWCTIGTAGNYNCQGTDGTASSCYDEEDVTACDVCGDDTPDDEIQYSDHHEQSICDHCAGRHFTRAVINRHRETDLIRDDDTVSIGINAYLNDSDLLSDLGFVQDEDDDWQKLDDCVYLESEDCYVLARLCTRLDVPHNGDDYARDSDATERDGQMVHVEHAAKLDAAEEAEAARVAAAERRASALRALAARRHNATTRRNRINARRAAR